MRNELDEQLCREFPTLFKDRYENPATTAMCWGFECEDGWYKVIRDLCTELSQTQDFDQLKATQVKEKYGSLRFYLNYESEVHSFLVREALLRSVRVCEICGFENEWLVKIREDHHWYLTRCLRCWLVYKIRRLIRRLRGD